MFSPNCVLLKLSPEIHIKTTFVQQFFIKKLKEHIKFLHKKKDVTIEKIEGERGRLLIYSTDLKKSVELLRKTFGVHEIAIAQEFKEKELKEIVEKALNFCENVFEENDSFAVRASVSGNKEFNSRDIEILLGEKILKKFSNLKVSLKNPKKEVFVEIKQKNGFAYFNGIKCLDGLPIGVEGNIALFFNGSNESVLATFLMLKRGCNVFPIVEKENEEISKNLSKLLPFNAFREFFLTQKNDLKKLIEEKDIVSFVFPLKKIGETSLNKMFENKSLELPVFYPLMGYPENELEKIEKLIE